MESRNGFAERRTATIQSKVLANQETVMLKLSSGMIPAVLSRIVGGQGWRIIFAQDAIRPFEFHLIRLATLQQGIKMIFVEIGLVFAERAGLALLIMSRHRR